MRASFRLRATWDLPGHVRLVSTNRGGYLNQKIAAKYAAKGHIDDPYVIEYDGLYYIAEGHHRAAGAMLRGESMIAARVKRAGGR